MARVEDHYAIAGIVPRVLAALRAANGADAPVTPDRLALIDHFHGRGVLATKELAALLAPAAGDRILDIGCGVGGPARWIAAKFACHVTGIDLTPEFCAAGRELTALCAMSDQVEILEANALALPFPDATFDRAYSHNVAMNIADKAGFYREAFRVLKPGGCAVFAHLHLGANGPPEYPQPWAAIAAHSFLPTEAETRRDLPAAGFGIVSYTDRTAALQAGAAAMRRKIETEGLPPLGVHVMLGPDFRQLQINTLRALEGGHTNSVEILARKPA